MVMGATLRLTEISIVRGAQLLLLILLIALFQGGGILYIALAVSFVNVLGYTAILAFLRQTVPLRLRENFGWPLLIGVVVALLMQLLVVPMLQNIFPAAATIENASVRLIGFGAAILVLCTGTEYLIRPALYRERLAEVASKLRRSK
jgi:hypothetical protein